MSDPTVKICLDHPQKWLQIFQVSEKAGRFGLVKSGQPPKYSPICLFLGGIFKIVIDIAKKKYRLFQTVQFSWGLMDPLLYKFAVVGCNKRDDAKAKARHGT